jgi:SDR family mycofactocin-dependent oxidoreductase
MGRSHALRLAAEGADLILVDVCAPVSAIGYPMSTPEDLADTAAQAEAAGAKVVAAQVDVTDGAALRDAVDTAVAAIGHLDGAVADAGVITSGTWDTVTDADWQAVLNVNLRGVWNTCAAAIPHLVRRGGGSLVNIGSAGGLKGQPFCVPYAAAKHGVIGLSRALANELAAHSIRVNVVHPTGVFTGIVAPDMVEQLSGARSDLIPLFQNALPIDLVEPIDVSHAVVYLLSDESRYVTGTELKVDAGVTLR